MYCKLNEHFADVLFFLVSIGIVFGRSATQANVICNVKEKNRWSVELLTVFCN